MRPSQLFELLGEPGCGKPLSLKVTHMASGEPYAGWLEDSDGNLVASLDAFRFDFVHVRPIDSQAQTLAAKPLKETMKTPEMRHIAPDCDRFIYSEGWFDLGPNKANNGDQFYSVSFTSQSAALELIFEQHAWSGFCQIFVNDELHDEIDLFNPEMALTRRVKLALPEGEVSIKIVSAGYANKQAQGRQVIFAGADEYTGRLIEPPLRKKAGINRGGEFRPRFFEILDTLGPDATILDIGGGKRQLDDPRYLNLEYSKHDEPDIFGDATRLPFKDDTIDFIYTAAVLEHINNPIRAGREMHRVLKPGGKLLANSAFMQPVHSEGQHFFNHTIYGIDYVFNQFAEKKLSWGGSFSDIVDWFLDVTHVKYHVAQEKVESFMDIAREFDKVISYERLMYIASEVWVEAVK